ncbi:MAG: hypothetical protein ACYS1A_16605 [Planctomycetota bacterium]|jgi:hypothetical protein
MIKRHGGKPEVKYGYDGTVRGRPVEVRAVKKDTRFRIQEDVHKELLKSKGSYIFVNSAGRSRIMSAAKVDAIIEGGKWFKDRHYPHKFLKVSDVFT